MKYETRTDTDAGGVDKKSEPQSSEKKEVEVEVAADQLLEATTLTRKKSWLENTTSETLLSYIPRIQVQINQLEKTLILKEKEIEDARRLLGDGSPDVTRAQAEAQSMKEKKQRLMTSVELARQMELNQIQAKLKNLESDIDEWGRGPLKSGKRNAEKGARAVEVRVTRPGATETVEKEIDRLYTAGKRVNEPFSGKDASMLIAGRLIALPPAGLESLKLGLPYEIAKDGSRVWLFAESQSAVFTKEIGKVEGAVTLSNPRMVTSFGAPGVISIGASQQKGPNEAEMDRVYHFRFEPRMAQGQTELGLRFLETNEDNSKNISTNLTLEANVRLNRGITAVVHRPGAAFSDGKACLLLVSLR